MMAAEEHLIVFECHLSLTRQCRPFRIMLAACFFASLPRDLIQGNTERGNATDRSRVSGTRQGEPRGSERINTLAVLPKRATQKNGQILSAHAVAEIIEPEAVLASRLQPAWVCAPKHLLGRLACAAHGLPGRCFASATASRNGLKAI